ncbi:MAG: hypothetical protein VX265_12385 [Myxococcota bacterium]|nr:hypothetical protein [Myxococcota bacterium]
MSDGAGPQTPGDRPRGGLQHRFTDGVRRERGFLAFVSVAFVVSAATADMPDIARWVGFLLAGYAAVANDSIQTIGTFIASNKDQAWWKLWLFIGGIFLATVAWSWVQFDGDVTYQRLAAKGFETAPTEFSFLAVAAPVFLIILTRLKMPVSTTLLLLSSFATKGSGIGKVLSKSFLGYGLAFVIAMVVWLSLAKAFDRWFTGTPHPGWRVAQWLASGLLWSVWIQQDAANIAVYLPRQLDFIELCAFAGVIFIGLGILFRMGGERIQQIVEEKSDVFDLRAATIIALVYAVILFYFKLHSKVPMSTTWVFLGLLGGRELAMTLRGSGDRSTGAAVRMMLRDAGLAATGLAVSLILACVVNEVVRDALLSSIGLGG